ncbi:MAG: hypothetical protein A4E53_04660 [Pelotomaculum sp. PtaB.Bin104]|nr:MAG: hypothetical protein A4E53_04660 [Pelotomaculum sp. PtaB.Bin104]
MDSEKLGINTNSVPKPKPLESCFSYIELGLPIIPCCSPGHEGMTPKHKAACKSLGKAPLIPGWPKRAETTSSELSLWLNQWPYANPGLPLGSASRLVGIDIDGEIGEQLLLEWSGGDIPTTWEFSTGAGRRLLYRLPEGVTLKKHVQADRTKEHEECALLGEGQQTVIPPAIHASGREYRWAPGRDPFTFGPPTGAPGWMIGMMAVKKVTSIEEAKGKRSKKNQGEDDPESHLNKLAEKCQRFSSDWKQQQNNGVDEEAWFLWTSLLIASGYDSAAIKFSRASVKHDKRSDTRLIQMIERQEVDPVPPVRCTTLGCSPDKIQQCHEKIRVNRDNEITNSPAAFIISKWFAARRYFMEKKFIPKRLGDHILEDYYFLFAGQTLYFYQGGVYIDGGTDLIRKECKERLDTEFKKDRVNEVIYYIETASMHDSTELNTRTDVINVKNGLLKWKTGELLPHNPKYFCTIQLPVNYNLNASCPNIDRFLCEILPADCLPTVEEMFGYSTLPVVALQKAFMLTGSGSNGKGTLIDLLSAFIGKQNISNVPLQELSDHRFKRAEIFGKLINVFADLSSKALENTSYFKMIVTGDEIDAERKHKDPFFFRPFARLVFSANELPRTTDQTYAYFRRWIIIPFQKRFVIGENADTGILKKITTEQELSGLLNRALNGLRRVQATKTFTVTEATREALEKYRLANDTVAAFAKECCITGANITVGKTNIYTAYKNWCSDCGLRSLSARRFYARVFELHPEVKETRPTGGQRVLHGIALESDESMLPVDEAPSDEDRWD